MRQSSIAVNALYVALFITTAERGYSAVSAGDNANEFNLLCKLVALAESTPPHATVKATDDTTAAEIMRLNMTLSDPEWQQMFVKDAATKTMHNSIPPNLSTHTEWPEYWSSWSKAAEDVLKNENMKQIEAMKLSALTAEQRTQATTAVRQIAEETLQIQKRKDQLKNVLATVKKPPQETLKTVVYGSSDKTASTVLHTDAYKNGGTDYSTACSGTASAIQVKSIAGIIACLCMKADSSDEPQACGTTVKINTNTWTVASPPNAEVVKEPLGFCNRASPPTLNANYIKAIIADLQSAIKIKGNAGILGASETGNSCGGKTTDGLCVKVNDWADNGIIKLTKLTWLQPLETLAEELEEQEQAVAEAAALDKRLKNIKQKALKVGANSWHIKEPDTAKQKDGTGQTQHNSAGPTRDRAKAEKECNAAGGDEGACDKLKEKDCVFNKNAKKCELMCVCAESDTAHDGACAHKVGIDTAWNAASVTPSSATTAWTAIKTACVPAKKATIGAEAIRHQQHALAMAIQPGSGSAHYLGAVESGSSCSGAKTAGVCVKYTNYNPAAGKGLEATQWGKKLATLANKLEQRDKAIQEATFLLKAIQAEATAAMATAGQTATAEWPTAPSSAAQTGAQTAGKKGKASDTEEECNAAGEDKTECDQLEKQGCFLTQNPKSVN
ncbi:variant surface glycoprotein (VSG), putative [Trypanosoma equiperdum]|uniref:Variant surface glycoprotein (VSG), putative n=1 Tax=Trypanosoma equiperdum TaxID=5694 RepID=A0A1G4IBN5_TRYEQ|nr:variant surface glycoprotein (VSG), putative [Trypanosoma equiperdum]